MEVGGEKDGVLVMVYASLGCEEQDWMLDSNEVSGQGAVTDRAKVVARG